MHPDGTVQVEALTPAFRADCDFRDERQRELLARFVRALGNAFEGLKAFYDSAHSSPIPIPSSFAHRPYKDAQAFRCWYPYVQSYTHRGETTKHTFRYKSRLMQGTLVFLASLTDGSEDELVVKFTQSYSEDVHDLLEREGFAPKLHAVENLAGGWKMVVMEYLSGWVMLQTKTHAKRQKYKAKVENAVVIMHDRGFVHGDVRGQNILVREDDSADDIKLIDFDHCGVHMQDVYPREWDHTFRQCDAKEGDVLRKGHDEYTLARIFDNSTTASRSFYHV